MMKTLATKIASFFLAGTAAMLGMTRADAQMAKAFDVVSFS
jgi:hypothetical protein